MVVIPLTFSADTGFAQIRVPRFSGAKVLRMQMGMSLRDRGLHGLRVDDLGAEIGELHGLVIGQRVDDLGVRHQPRIGRQHAVDVGPNDDFRSLEQGAENGAGEIAAVAAQGGLNPLDGGRHETGHDQPARESVGHQAPQVLLAHRPLHGRSQRTPLDDDDLARIDP